MKFDILSCEVHIDSEFRLMWIFLYLIASLHTDLSCALLNAVCEQAYTMSQNLDPNSDGRGVLQFKTGLMSVIKVLHIHNISISVVRC